jgi:hypothetical protein
MCVTKEILVNLPRIQLFSPASPSKSDQEAHTCVNAKRPGTERGLQRYYSGVRCGVERCKRNTEPGRSGERMILVVLAQSTSSGQGVRAEGQEDLRNTWTS